MTTLLAAIYLVPRGEGSADAALMGVFEQLAGELRFRREHHLVRDPGQLAVLLVGPRTPPEYKAPGLPAREAARHLSEQIFP